MANRMSLLRNLASEMVRILVVEFESGISQFVWDQYPDECQEDLDALNMSLEGLKVVRYPDNPRGQFGESSLMLRGSSSRMNPYSG